MLVKFDHQLHFTEMIKLLVQNFLYLPGMELLKLIETSENI